GDDFEQSYPLPASGWRALHPRSPNAGVLFKDKAGPITSITLEAGLSPRNTGKGADLDQTPASQPPQIQNALRLGSYRYFFEFGGDEQRFTPDKQLLRKWTLRPNC